jgi:aspartyl-tRNA synthetase
VWSSRAPVGNANPDLPTGEVEGCCRGTRGAESRPAPTPFQIDERVSVGEETRLKYRYLDLRRPGPAAAIRLRSEVNRVARTLLAERGFVEIETPTLTRSTLGGARVTSWYPRASSRVLVRACRRARKLFKQLLMVAGMERYYQIARCYRDEDFQGRSAARIHPARHRNELR